MKVIQNNFNKKDLNEIPISKTLHIECEHCGSELEITKEDTHIGWLGTAFVKCPCCNRESMVDELDGIILTKDNIKFPLHFNRTNKNMKRVKEISNEEIEENIQQAIEWFRTNKDESCWYTSFGDLFMVVFKYDGDEEYFVVVTKDYYETYISFEKEDYNDEFCRLVK